MWNPLHSRWVGIVRAVRSCVVLPQAMGAPGDILSSPRKRLIVQAMNMLCRDVKDRDRHSRVEEGVRG